MDWSSTTTKIKMSVYVHTVQKIARWLVRFGHVHKTLPIAIQSEARVHRNFGAGHTYAKSNPPIRYDHPVAFQVQQAIGS